MCDVLVTKDGIELRTIADARRYNIAVPDTADHHYYGADTCFCDADLEAVLAAHPSSWRQAWTMSGGGWSEVGDDGRTWWEGYDIETPDPKYPSQCSISRSDGRSELTLDEWEAQQHTGGAATREGVASDV